MYARTHTVRHTETDRHSDRRTNRQADGIVVYHDG